LTGSRNASQAGNPAREAGNPTALGETNMSDDRSATAYWSANIRIITICLVIWAVVSFGFAIILRPLLAMLPITIGGTDLGFWFAQQGSILTFIGLIFYYTWYMNRLDRKFGVDEE
jgi:putative solute:sodium symporter small subunit